MLLSIAVVAATNNINISSIISVKYYKSVHHSSYGIFFYLFYDLQKLTWSQPTLYRVIYNYDVFCAVVFVSVLFGCDTML